MKNKILIFLILLAFNANVMVRVILIPDMGISMSIEGQQTSHNHLKKNSDEMFAARGELSQKNSSGCDEDVSCSSCLTHCTSVVFLTLPQKPSGIFFAC